jgi:hypothetical protein
MPPCLPHLHLLLRAAASLQSAAADLDLAAVLAHDPALTTDALVLADAIDAEVEALVAVPDRLGSSWRRRASTRSVELDGRRLQPCRRRSSTDARSVMTQHIAPEADSRSSSSEGAVSRGPA